MTETGFVSASPHGYSTAVLRLCKRTAAQPRRFGLVARPVFAVDAAESRAADDSLMTHASGVERRARALEAVQTIKEKAS
jgi:hypothetical protein